VSARVLQAGAVASLISPIVLCLVWEVWLAPLQPGGSWLSLKAVPLLAPLLGLLHGRRYTFQWTSFLALPYFAEGIMRAWSEPAPARTLATLEIVLSLGLFACAVLGARALARTV